MRIASAFALLALSAPPVLAASPGQADICHWSDDTASFSVISVSVRAVPAHLANHGDSYAAIYFADADGDGHGDSAGATDRCPNDGFVADNTDCDDAAADVNPAAAEVPYDGVDNDCADGTVDDDLDQDGFLLAGDCDDADASVNPAAEDVCDDGVDNNCDGSIDENCAGDCPCFTAADMDAAYAAYQAFTPDYTDYNYSYAYCQEYIEDYTTSYNDYTWHYEYTGVWFDAFSADTTSDYYWYWQAYEGSYAGFYGVHYEQSYSGSDYAYAYCNAYTNEYSYDGTTYTNDYQQNSLSVTALEAEACEAVVAQWAVDNGMECPTYTYNYSY